MTENCLISSLFSLDGCIFFYLWSFLSCTTETCIACDSVVTVSFPRCPPHLSLFRDVVKYVNRLARYTKRLGTLMAKIKLIYKKCLGPYMVVVWVLKVNKVFILSKVRLPTLVGFSVLMQCACIYSANSQSKLAQAHLQKNPPKPGSHYWAGAQSFLAARAQPAVWWSYFRLLFLKQKHHCHSRHCLWLN